MSLINLLTYSPRGDKAPSATLCTAINNALNELAGIEDDYETSSVSILSSLTLGNGTLVGYHHRIKGRVTGYGSITFGTTTSVSGNVAVSGAGPAVNAATVGDTAVACLLWDNSANQWHPGGGQMDENGTLILSKLPTGTISSTQPFTWAVNDKILWRFDCRQPAKASLLR